MEVLLNKNNIIKYSSAKQILISSASVILISSVCFAFSKIIGYKVVALLLLFTVSILAMLFSIYPVLLAAVLSAFIWNFFFIPPIFTFHIHNTDDTLLFLMYFVIALLNGVLTIKIREAEKISRDKEEKENTIKLYNTLLNSLSHELRTPISTIIGAIDTLKENNKNLSVEIQQELLNEIDIASIRLNRQVDNLLSMSRLETGILQIKKDWCDVNELVFSAIKKSSELSQKQKLIFIPNERLPLFKLDGALIENVLHNLISNAIQYTPENTVIEIKVSNLNDKLLIIISDNGNGFPDSEIKFVFDKFYRLPNTKSGGTGLGLSISKGFINAHSGTISLENIDSGGAKFTIEIPSETSFISNLKNE